MNDSNISKIVQDRYGIINIVDENVRKFQRRDSTVWILTLTTPEKEETYFIKKANAPQDRQAALCIDAERSFENCDFFQSLNTTYVPSENLIISRKSEFLRLQEQIALNGLPNPVSWYQQLNRVVTLAGKWLKSYHEYGRKKQGEDERGSVRSPLLRYIEAREYILGTLPSNLQKRFLQSVQDCPDHYLTAIHSDFAPPNIFSNGEKISVIDFGVEEWTAMSPYWDIATFTIYMERESQFRMKSPLKWLPFLRARVLANFFDSYGDVYGEDSEVWRVCRASRHFALLSALVKSDTADGRLAWHIENMESLLEPRAV